MSQFQKFKLIMELFDKYAELLQEQRWLEIVVFEIPSVSLTRQDQEDLNSVITSKVSATVIFERTPCNTIQVSVRRKGKE